MFGINDKDCQPQHQQVSKKETVEYAIKNSEKEIVENTCSTGHTSI